MRPPEKFRTATRFCAAHQRYEGRKPEPRAYVQGLDVRTISGRRRDIFLDILFIECNQALDGMRRSIPDHGWRFRLRRVQDDQEVGEFFWQ